MDSGTAFIEDIFNGGVLGPKYSNFSYVASHFGCGNTKSPAEELLCMKKVDAASIEAFLLENYNNESIPSLAFGPAADEKIVFANWTDRVRQGKISKVVSTPFLHRKLGT